jgi:hypothetical protein
MAELRRKLLALEIAAAEAAEAERRASELAAIEAAQAKLRVTELPAAAEADSGTETRRLRKQGSCPYLTIEMCLLPASDDEQNAAVDDDEESNGHAAGDHTDN